jgi:hypothetical protein
VAAWTFDLLTKTHPTTKPEDFTIVEDTHTNKIVSSLNLISQTWSYAGIPFGVGRPELVGTLPEYRERGLVRAQFDVIHAWSAERGEKMQAITGIPYYYRQFGYEMTINLGGGRLGYQPHVPKLPDGKEEPFVIRPAREADILFVDEIYRQAGRRYLLRCEWTPELWLYELQGKSEKNVNRSELRIIETPGGERLGFLAHPWLTWGPTQVATVYELVPGANWGEVTPGVVRYLYQTGKTKAAEDGKEAEFSEWGFWLGVDHPVYQVLRGALAHVRPPYAWYIRIPDLVDFLRHISAALETRMQNSLYAGYSGDLKLSFYRRGLRLVFEDGKLVKGEDWKPVPVGHSGNACFPDLTFLQLFLGYRSVEELRYAFPDCTVRGDEAAGLLNALFPKQVSDIWPIS